MSETTLLAVCGSLMRGHKLNHHMTDMGAKFVREDSTDAHYRMWSINDDHPAMVRDSKHEARTSVHVEIWEVPNAGVVWILENQPFGLSIGKVVLANGSKVLGILGEPWFIDGHHEVSKHRGWHAYHSSRVA